ncbi:MAG: hypothetical protein A2014_12540 [Spirochaetes bacterium GWF1_49_6]|nr:MAG: hypothetical protein A2014_12540 [Spirochaetes bacterium GWF1_49_6]
MDMRKLSELLSDLPGWIDLPEYEKYIDLFIRETSPMNVFISREDMKKVLLRDQVLAAHFVTNYVLKDD